MDYSKPYHVLGGGVILGSAVLGQYWILESSIVIVVIGAILIRIFFRKGKDVTQR